MEILRILTDFKMIIKNNFSGNYSGNFTQTLKKFQNI